MSSSHHYAFDDGSSKLKKPNRRKNKNPYNTPSSTGAGVGTTSQSSSTYHNILNDLDINTALSQTPSLDDDNDGAVGDGEESNSLAYSASSSQAGESTDSSVAELTYMLQVEREQQQHVRDLSVSRKNSGSVTSTAGTADSMGYSTDSYSDAGVNVNVNVNSNANMGDVEETRRGKNSGIGGRKTNTGQPSDSHANDGGGFSKNRPSSRIYASSGSGNANTNASGSGNAKGNSHDTFTKNRPSPRNPNVQVNTKFPYPYSYSKSSPSPKSITYKSPVSASQFDSHSNCNSTGSRSGSGSVTNSFGHSHSHGSTTPRTPPPRHSSRKMMTNDEVWYQKWWMCGFTDALNINPKG